MNFSLPASLEARYEPLTELGAGAFGQVLLCRDRALDREVALKRLHQALDDPEVRARFEREAKITAGLEHPGVVRLYDFGVLEDGGAFIAYERIEGSDLETWLRRHGPASTDRLQAWGCRLAEALAAVHRVGVIHRDVKPANILLRSESDPVLVDFGIARVNAGGTQYTAAGMILGTPEFMAPELWREEPPSPSSDQFALAATLAVLAGLPDGVFGARDLGGILKAVQSGGVALPKDAPLGALRVPLTRALAASPADRYPDMEAFAAALSEAVAVGTTTGRAAKVTAARTLVMKPPQEAARTLVTEVTAGASPGSGRFVSIALLAGLGIAAAVTGIWGTGDSTDVALGVPTLTPEETAAVDPSLGDLLRALSAAERALETGEVPRVARAGRFSEEGLTRRHRGLSRLGGEFFFADLAKSHEAWLRAGAPGAKGPENPEDRIAEFALVLQSSIHRIRKRVEAGGGPVPGIDAQPSDADAYPEGWDLAAYNEYQGQLREVIDRYICALDAFPGDVDRTITILYLATAYEHFHASATRLPGPCRSFATGRGDRLVERLLPALRGPVSRRDLARRVDAILQLAGNSRSQISWALYLQLMREVLEAIGRLPQGWAPFLGRGRMLESFLFTGFKHARRLTSKDHTEHLGLIRAAIQQWSKMPGAPRGVLRSCDIWRQRDYGYVSGTRPDLDAVLAEFDRLLAGVRAGLKEAR